jgi:hypothetical protein
MGPMLQSASAVLFKESILSNPASLLVISTNGIPIGIPAKKQNKIYLIKSITYNNNSTSPGPFDQLKTSTDVFFCA